jgi:hypothetical protein
MTPQMQLENRQLYRGMAKPIIGAKTGPEILQATGLDWKIDRVPLQYDYNGLQPFPDRDALVRNDTGKAIAHASRSSYHVHQNEEIIGGLVKLAEVGNIKVTHGGAVEGGTRVFIHGSIDKQFDAGVGKKLQDIGVSFLEGFA